MKKSLAAIVLSGSLLALPAMAATSSTTVHHHHAKTHHAKVIKKTTVKKVHKHVTKTETKSNS